MTRQKTFLTLSKASVKFQNNVKNLVLKADVVCEGQNQILMFVSPKENSGATTLASSFAEVVATEKKTLLVDCNYVDSDISKKYGLENVGLSDVFKGDKKLKDVVKKVDDLYILPSGEFLDAYKIKIKSEFEKLLDELKSTYERIIIDVPSCSVDALATTLNSICDGVVLVVKAGTRNSSVTQAFQNLDLGQAKIIGAVLNRI